MAESSVPPSPVRAHIAICMTGTPAVTNCSITVTALKSRCKHLSMSAFYDVFQASSMFHFATMLQTVGNVVAFWCSSPLGRQGATKPSGTMGQA